ncbi:PAS domain-containing protein [Novosphingobium sp. P6W]|uniref:PAS domain-containing protein n=1 Tax=Novosphingobium sp. P6W TaxID=1609758 RepID=UPI0005C2C6BE|nr:PAS domain-containing protein [Novosphingobium sp. P6W]KIS30356.1 hypothetical protein TQ38_22920 [Novosphingobium sp. P6W]
MSDGLSGEVSASEGLSERRLQALIEASPEVLYRMSPDWGEMRELAGGGFLSDTHDSNRAWLMDYIPSEDQGTVTAAIDQAIRNKAMFHLEHRVRRADGGIGWTLSRAVPILDDGGEIVEWAGAASDVTPRHEAEQQLRDLNATLEERIEERSAALRLYRNIVQSDASPVVAFDADLRVTAFNEAHCDDWQRIAGREAKVGEVLPDMLPPGQAAELRGFMVRALGGETFTVQAAFGDPDLAQPTWSITYNPLRDEEGNVVGAFHLRDQPFYPLMVVEDRSKPRFGRRVHFSETTGFGACVIGCGGRDRSGYPIYKRHRASPLLGRASTAMYEDQT